MSTLEPFSVVDVSDWNRVHEEPLGTKPKRWLQDPTTDLYWLMKDVTFNRRADGSSYAKGDDWAERIACAVAEQLGLPAASVELASGSPDSESAVGVVSLSMLADGEALIHGNELLAEVGISGADPHDRRGYTTDAVRRSLDSIEPPLGWEGSSWEVFVGYLVLDALIGNTDRHQENWAVIAKGDTRRLAPTFDHASCLGFQLDDTQRSHRLLSIDANQTPEAYADKAPSRFDGRTSPLELAVAGLRSLSTKEMQQWLDRAADPGVLIAAIARVPDERMSEPSREFAERVLVRNHSRLTQAFGTV